LVADWWVADGRVAGYGLRGSKGGSVAGCVLREAILRGIGRSRVSVLNWSRVSSLGVDGSGGNEGLYWLLDDLLDEGLLDYGLLL
jgi:hypothetical protein